MHTFFHMLKGTKINIAGISILPWGSLLKAIYMM
jgi:hypothetical protein